MNAIVAPIRTEAAGLAAILYRSTASDSIEAFEASGAPADFAARNRATGVTGYLHVEDGRFYQYFEGPSDAVSVLWAAIQRDPRHRDIEILSRGAVGARRFDRWAMGYSQAEARSLFDWTARSGLSLKGPKLPQVVTGFLEYASACKRKTA